MFITIQKRTFTFPIKDSKLFFCENITITKYPEINNFVNNMRSISKNYFWFLIFIFMAVYSSIHNNNIQTIWKKYIQNMCHAINFDAFN
jgi:hypothetical protein